MTHRVGSDLTETARKTTDSIAKLHERLAVIDSAQKNLTDLSSNMVSLAGDPRQQAGARRLRPDAHGGHHPGRPAQGRLHLPGHPLQRQASRLPVAYAEHQGRRGDRRQVPAGRLRGVPRGPGAGGEEGRGAARARRCRAPCRCHGRALFPARRDAGHRHPVRAVGGDLCGFGRALLRSRAEGAPRPHRHLRAEHAHARGADHAGDPQGREDARAGPSHSARGDAG